MKNKPFVFKQFQVWQDQCAMKIGTDAVLLGAWTPVNHHPNSILDIGAGTGILSLMLAQRSTATIIDALEMEPNAYQQCVLNFENSPWNNRLFCYHATLQEFVSEIDETYELIICNPPFYSENYTSANKQRNLARFNKSMPMEQLIPSAAKLLSENGKFSVIIPFKEEKKFIAIAAENALFINKTLHVQGTKNANIKRSLLQFSFKKCAVKKESLIIETKRQEYTTDYTNLTKDFYLKM